MKFRVRVHECKWNGNRCTQGRQVKQKTFEADDWNKAEAIAYKIFKEAETANSEVCDFSLSVIG